MSVRVYDRWKVMDGMRRKRRVRPWTQSRLGRAHFGSLVWLRIEGQTEVMYHENGMRNMNGQIIHLFITKREIHSI